MARGKNDPFQNDICGRTKLRNQERPFLTYKKHKKNIVLMSSQNLISKNTDNCSLSPYKERERELSDSWFVRGRAMDVFESERC